MTSRSRLCYWAIAAFVAALSGPFSWRMIPPGGGPTTAAEPNVAAHPTFLPDVAPSLRAKKEPAISLPPATVCLDPGHPSEKNSGRAVQNGTTESEMNWMVATQLRDQLEGQGVRVVMTKRSRDEYVTNRRRAEIANQSGAALFFRIHCDTGKGSGLTTYCPAQAGVVHGIRGPSGQVRRASARAAHLIHAVMAQHLCLPLHDNGVKTDRQTAIGRRQGALTGSIFAKVPTVTVEMVYLSHPDDAAFIRSHEGQERMVEAMSAAILEYVCLRVTGET